MASDIKDPQGRKWQITINFPIEKGLTHDAIKLKLASISSIEYYAMSDEIGEQGNFHTHIFLVSKTPIRFSRLKKLFPEAHIERCQGTIEDNILYLKKEGKWEGSKDCTSVPDSFEEHGDRPEEPGQGFRSDIAEIYNQISDGLSNAEIMARNPDTAKHIGKFDKIRQEILEERFRNTFRNLHITYIWGPTETGKTRTILEKHGYANVFRATNYYHPFDNYSQQSVILFEEFRSSLPLSDMLVYLEGYPVSLPARYANKVACYETVYIVSNIDLKKQYPLMQQEEPASWKAFLRRINQVIEYRKDASPIEHGSGMDYIFPPEPSWLKEAEQAKQIEFPIV